MPFLGILGGKWKFMEHNQKRVHEGADVWNREQEGDRSLVITCYFFCTSQSFQRFNFIVHFSQPLI